MHRLIRRLQDDAAVVGGFGGTWCEQEYRVEVGYCGIGATLRVVRGAATKQRVDVVGASGEHAIEGSHGFVDATRGVKCESEVEQGFGIAGIGRHRCRVAPERLFEAPQPPQRIAAAAQCRHARGLQRKRAVVVREGLRVLAQRAQDALGSDTNEVALLDDAGTHRLPRMDKLALARRLVAEIARRLPAGGA